MDKDFEYIEKNLKSYKNSIKTMNQFKWKISVLTKKKTDRISMIFNVWWFKNLWIQKQKY